MKRNFLLKVINTILAILMVNQILTGILNDELPRWVFEHFHVLGGILFAVFGILHIIMNWNWVKMNYFRHQSSPNDKKSE